MTDAVRERQEAERELRAVSSRYERARASVATLQRALLPDHVPVLPLVEVSAHHLLAGDEATAGGDWFDTVQPDG